MLLLQPFAYVGPGPGLTMLWAFIALLGTICLSVLYLLFWPLRMLIRRMRGTPAEGSAAAPPDGEAAPSTGTPLKVE